MGTVLSLLFIICAILPASAQITFQKTYGGVNTEDGFSVKPTVDGGYIIAGTTFSFTAGDRDFYLLKTDSAGNLQWTKTFGGIATDVAWCVLQTFEGGYMIAGWTWSFGLNDIYLVKTDSAGNLQWSKTIGGSIWEYSYSIDQTTDGGYVISGSTESYGAGDRDIYLVKIDAIGNLLWTKSFGGTGSDDGSAVKQTTDGGYIIAASTFSFGAGSSDLCLVKTDSVGNLLWTKTYGGANWDYSACVDQAADSGYVIAGKTFSFGSGNWDVYLVRTNASGDILWTKTFGGNGQDEGRYVKQTTDGGFVVTGWTASFGAGNADVYLIKTDVSGNLLWSKTYGGTGADEGRCVQQTNDGGYVITGNTNNSFAGLNPEIYLVKTDSSGVVGCSEMNSATLSSVAATPTSSPLLLVSSGGVAISAPTVVGSGGTFASPCATTGMGSISSNVQATFTIVNDPSTDDLALFFDSRNKFIEVSIFNSAGQLMYNSDFRETGEIRISTKKFEEGIYLVNIKTEKFAQAKKLVITR